MYSIGHISLTEDLNRDIDQNRFELSISILSQLSMNTFHIRFQTMLTTILRYPPTVLKFIEHPSISPTK
jgi:hypothetical protein